MTGKLSPGELDLPGADDEFTVGGTGAGISPQDFWRWMMTDLRMNTTRAFLGEFLVTRALENPDSYREEWASFDVLAASGTKVEVKTAGLAQS